LAGIREEGRIGRLDAAEEENIGAGIEHRVVQRTKVVGCKTVGKLPQVVCTALERMIHIPHLVFRQKWLVEEGKAMHSADKGLSMVRDHRNLR
jgi:hypothetical protein